ncbi:MAG: ArsR family transcriptional regulator [Cyanobacteria bacterium P01_D01_bin.71]
MLSSLRNALAHPVRLQIVQILAKQSDCICSEVLPVGSFSQSTVLQHLRSLQRVGLIQGQVDGPNRCYWLNTDMLNTLKRLVEQL